MRGEDDEQRRRAGSEQLRRHNALGTTSVAHIQAFADTEDNVQARSLGSQRLGSDIGVRFTLVLTAFAMANDRPARARFREHRR